MNGSFYDTGRRDFMMRSAGAAVGLHLSSILDTQLAAGEESPLFSFGVIADIQYCDCEPKGSRYYCQSPLKLEACVQALNAHNPAFVVQLGDLIDRDFASYDTILPIFDQISSPKYHVLGNHDFSVTDDDKLRVLDRLGLESNYYSFAHKGVRFVVMDGNDVSLYAVPSGTPRHREARRILNTLKKSGAENAQEWNGAVGGSQLKWFEETLRKAGEDDEPVVVFCHFPVFPPNVHNLWNDGAVIDSAQVCPHVAAYMNGHNHAGNYGEKNGIHYLTFQGMVETPDTTAYAVVDVYRDRFKIRGYGREPERDLALRTAGRKS